MVRFYIEMLHLPIGIRYGLEYTKELGCCFFLNCDYIRFSKCTNPISNNTKSSRTTPTTLSKIYVTQHLGRDARVLQKTTRQLPGEVLSHDRGVAEHGGTSIG